MTPRLSLSLLNRSIVFTKLFPKLLYTQEVLMIIPFAPLFIKASSPKSPGAIYSFVCSPLSSGFIWVCRFHSNQRYIVLVGTYGIHTVHSFRLLWEIILVKFCNLAIIRFYKGFLGKVPLVASLFRGSNFFNLGPVIKARPHILAIHVLAFGMIFVRRLSWAN